MSIGTLDLKLPIPAMQGFCGNRLVTYATQLKPKSIIALLGHDPRSKNWRNLPTHTREIYEHLQRKTVKSRRDSIAFYIEERFSADAVTIGAFPAISVGFVEPLEFVDEGDRSGVGILKIDISPSTVRVMLDGLGRVTGALDLLEEERDEVLENFVFPITIFAPRPDQQRLSYDELGQLFHDMNFKVQPVSKSHAVALDTSDLYIALANRICDIPIIADNGGVAKKAASLGKKSTELVVQTVLVRFCRGALEGRSFQESNMATTDSPNLTRQNFTSTLSSVDAFLTAFGNAMGDRFKDVKRDSIHLTSPGWQALGVLYHDLRYKLKLNDEEVKMFAGRAAEVDWSRYNPDWVPMLGQPEIDKVTNAEITDSQGRKRVAIQGAGRSNVQNILDYLRRKLNLADGISDAIQGEEVDAGDL
jgi:DGQHR domain-containing protein